MRVAPPAGPPRGRAAALWRQWRRHHHDHGFGSKAESIFLQVASEGLAPSLFWGPVAYILMFPHGQAFKDAGFMQRVYDAGCRRGWKAQPVNEETTIQLTVLKSLGLLSGVSNCDLPWITFPARPEVTHFLVKHAQPQGFMCHICHLGSTNGKTCNQLQLQITSFQLRMSNIRTPKTIKKKLLKMTFSWNDHNHTVDFQAPKMLIPLKRLRLVHCLFASLLQHEADVEAPWWWCRWPQVAP